MVITRVAIAAFAAAVLSIFAAPAANAAYAPPPFSADVPDGVGPGEEFTITFDSGNVDCDWSLSPFNGQTAPGGSGTTYTVTLTAPDDDGTYTVTANCTWDPDNVNPAVAPASSSTAVTPAVYSSTADVSSDSLLAVPQTDSYSVQIVVGDGGDDGDGGSDDGDSASGGLPATGGSNLTLLAAGAGLVVAGAGVTYAARRRKTA